MKYVKTKYNTTSKKHSRILNRLKAVKQKKDRMEFLSIYVMNKNNEFVKRVLEGNHFPGNKSNRAKNKRKNYYKIAA